MTPAFKTFEELALKRYIAVMKRPEGIYLTESLFLKALKAGDVYFFQ